jgi:hypothetical protein
VGSNGVSLGLGGIRSYELECFSFVGESAMGRWDGWSGGEMGWMEWWGDGMWLGWDRGEGERDICCEDDTAGVWVMRLLKWE